MCMTCHGKGGLTVERSWGAEFVPCPDTNCDFDKEKEQNRILNTLEKKVAEILERETA